MIYYRVLIRKLTVFYFNGHTKCPGGIWILLGMILIGFLDPDPHFRITDPRIRIRMKYSRIYNTVKSQSDINQADKNSHLKSTVPYSVSVW